MTSISMPFSASTIRTRWLCGSSGAENKVMIDRRLAIIPGSQWRSLSGCRHVSVHVFPVFLLQQQRHPGKGQQKQHYPDTHAAPGYLGRLTGIVEEVHSITNEEVVLLGGQLAWCRNGEMIELLLAGTLAAGRRRGAERRLFDALELGQHRRHRRVRQLQIIRARRPTGVDIKRLQEAVQIV